MHQLRSLNPLIESQGKTSIDVYLLFLACEIIGSGNARTGHVRDVMEFITSVWWVIAVWQLVGGGNTRSILIGIC